MRPVCPTTPFLGATLLQTTDQKVALDLGQKIGASNFTSCQGLFYCHPRVRHLLIYLVRVRGWGRFLWSNNKSMSSSAVSSLFNIIRPCRGRVHADWKLPANLSAMLWNIRSQRLGPRVWVTSERPGVGGLSSGSELGLLAL